MANGTLKKTKSEYTLLATGENVESSTIYQLVDSHKFSEFDEIIFAAYNTAFNTILGSVTIPTSLFTQGNQYIVNYTTIADCRAQYSDDTHVRLWKDTASSGNLIPKVYGVKR